MGKLLKKEVNMAWFENPKKLKRILKEKELMQKHYPDFKWDVTQNDEIVLYGNIGPSNVLEQKYVIGIYLPDNYGSGIPPKVFLLNKDIRQTYAPHVYSDDSLCLFHNDGEYTARTSLVTVLNWVSAWLALYENYLKTGERW